MTWIGHCITNVTVALRALPTAGQLRLIGDLRDFLNRQEQEIRRTELTYQIRSVTVRAPE